MVPNLTEFFSHLQTFVRLAKDYIKQLTNLLKYSGIGYTRGHTKLGNFLLIYYSLASRIV